MSERVNFSERVRFANEIGRLQAENEMLRKELAVTNPLFETLNSSNDRLIYENMKLRELVRELYEDQCDECDKWKYRDRMRELGVEV